MPIEDRVKRWIKPAIQAMSAYKVANAEGMIKLDAMENPYSIPDELLESYLQSIKIAAINRYPDPDCEALKPLLKSTFSIPNELEVIFGNGSDELIQIIIMALAGAGRAVMAPAPSFVMYQVVAESLDLQFIPSPLRDDFSIDIDNTVSLIEQYQPAVIFLAYPNNPTGNLFDKAAIDAIVQAAEGLVIIDEAYHSFSKTTYINTLLSYENVMVLRTLSKAGLAGLRFGFLVGAPQWINEMNKIRLPYNINSLTQLSVEFFLKNYSVLLQQAEHIINERQRVFDDLSMLKHVITYPSEANFLLFKVLDESAELVFNHLLNNKVLIKKMPQTNPLLENCLRVSIGKPSENTAFLQYLKTSLA